MTITDKELVNKQQALVFEDPSFCPTELSYDKDNISVCSVIYLKKEDSVHIVEDVGEGEVRCIGFSDDSFNIVKISEDIVILGYYII